MWQSLLWLPLCQPLVLLQQLLLPLHNVLQMPQLQGMCKRLALNYFTLVGNPE